MLHEWFLQDIERKASNAAPAYQVDALRGDVDRLERTVRELSAVVDGLRHELAAAQVAIETLQNNPNA